MFTVHQNGAGIVDGVNKVVDGISVSVPLTIENQDFCDFLTWDCRQPHPIDPSISPPPGQHNFYFSDLTRLVENCRNRGMMIYVRREEDIPPTVGFGDVVDYAPINGPVSGSFSVLREAVEDDDRMFHHETCGITSRQTNICVSPNLFNAINAGIADEASDIRRLVSWPIRRVFVYVDVSDFSTMPPGQQALVINSISNIVEKDAWETQTPRNYEAKLCIGDGYIFVFGDALDAVRFAGQLAMLVET